MIVPIKSVGGAGSRLVAYLLRVCSVVSPCKGTFIWSCYGAATEQNRF